MNKIFQRLSRQQSYQFPIIVFVSLLFNTSNACLAQEALVQTTPNSLPATESIEGLFFTTKIYGIGFSNAPTDIGVMSTDAEVALNGKEAITTTADAANS